MAGRPPLAPTGCSWFIGGVSPPPDRIFSEYGLNGLSKTNADNVGVVEKYKWGSKGSKLLILVSRKYLGELCWNLWDKQ